MYNNYKLKLIRQLDMFISSLVIFAFIIIRKTDLRKFKLVLNYIKYCTIDMTALKNSVKTAAAGNSILMWIYST